MADGACCHYCRKYACECVGEPTPPHYAGSDWVKGAHGKAMSLFGERVADLLGDLFFGIYHIAADVRRADFGTTGWVDMTICGQSWGTWDSNLLTRLVILAHDRCIRVEMEPVAPRTMRIRFHPREREGDIYRRHPTIEEAIALQRRI